MLPAAPFASFISKRMIVPGAAFKPKTIFPRALTLSGVSKLVKIPANPSSIPTSVSGNVDDVSAALIKETNDDSAGFANEESDIQLLTSDKQEAGDISNSYDETKL